MNAQIMTKSEFLAWKEIMEHKIEQKELTPLEEGNVRIFCILQWINPCWYDDESEEEDED